MDKKIKTCKRDKCPHYKEHFKWCVFCEWNPNRVWVAGKKV